MTADKRAMRGHPIFLAQHATATCCRSCLSKWHHIPPGREITEEEIDYILAVFLPLAAWGKVVNLPNLLDRLRYFSLPKENAWERKLGGLFLS